MQKKYKITIGSIIRECGLHILVLFFFLCTLLRIYGKEPDNGRFLWGAIGIGIFLLVTTVFPLIIYWNHYLHDKDVVLIIDKNANEFVYQNRGVSKKIKLTDIRCARRYHCPLRSYTMRYYRLFLNDNTQIIITSLLAFGLLGHLNRINIVSESTYNMFLGR